MADLFSEYSLQKCWKHMKTYKTHFIFIKHKSNREMKLQTVFKKYPSLLGSKMKYKSLNKY